MFAICVALAAMIAFLASTRVAPPWDIAATLGAAFAAVSALLLFLAGRAQQPI